MDDVTLPFREGTVSWDVMRRPVFLLGGCSHPDCSGGNDEGPPFAYTVGLFGMGHPELLIFSLPLEATCRVLNAFGERIRNGENLMAGQELTLGDHDRRYVAEVVPNPGEIVFWANDFYRRPAEFSVPLLQLSYDDGTGVYPWDAGHPAPGSQPRPGSFTA